MSAVHNKRKEMRIFNMRTDNKNLNRMKPTRRPEVDKVLAE
jgi:hypothetical protein